MKANCLLHKYLGWLFCGFSHGRCAMALVHQRIKRIFYAFPNAKAGALGSVHRLQGEKSLNHHYAVFNVLLPQESLNRGAETKKPSNLAHDVDL